MNNNAMLAGMAGLGEQQGADPSLPAYASGSTGNPYFGVRRCWHYLLDTSPQKLTVSIYYIRHFGVETLDKRFMPPRF
jgi:hypothetical protein